MKQRKNRLPVGQKRNPSAPHVRQLIKHREKIGRPKAEKVLGEGGPFTLEQYGKFTDAYETAARRHREESLSEVSRQIRIISFLMLSMHGEEHKKANGVLQRLMRRTTLTVSDPSSGHMIASEILRDFKKTKGLKVFGFGIGYGQLLFFLRNFMKVKVRGVDSEDITRDFTKGRKLGIIYGKDVGDPSLRELGKFDVIYSINVLETDVIDKAKALEMLDNAAHLTRKGGRSYHIIVNGEVPVTRKEIEARGFKIEKEEKIFTKVFLKLRKVRN